jgi:phosphatidylglycerol:prolipoprotein diacylglycerol transferase
VHFSDKGHEVTSVPTIVAHLPAAMQQQWAATLGGLTAPIHLHPVQLYEVGATLVIFAFLLWLARRRGFHGQIILLYALLYAVARFVLEFWRADPRGSLLGLSTSQFIALLIFVSSLATYIYHSRARKNSAQI